MVLNFTEKEQYIDHHLFNELRWLLNAATEWSIQRHLNLQICGYDIQVYAMDSAVLHARALFEFFVQAANVNHYGSDQFLGVSLKSDIYSHDWRDTLHRFLMHANDRSRPTPLKNAAGVETDLNKMPAEFANESLRLWAEFEAKLVAKGDKKLGELAREKRKAAIESAACVANCVVARHHAEVKGEVLKPIFVFAG
jgi:hypothetical protein